MMAEDARQVHLIGELAAGDEIEAWHNGKMFHRGTVIRTVAVTDLFWIVDARTGVRRLIDTEALVILRAEAAAPAAAGPATAPAAAAPTTAAPASHLPLFQAPSPAILTPRPARCPGRKPAPAPPGDRLRELDVQ